MESKLKEEIASLLKECRMKLEKLLDENNSLTPDHQVSLVGSIERGYPSIMLQKEFLKDRPSNQTPLLGKEIVFSENC